MGIPPAAVHPHKLKKNGESLSLALRPTRDILQEVGALPNRPYLVGFCAETERFLPHAQDKLQRKNLDLIVINDVSRSDIGFDAEDNAVQLLFKDAPAPLTLDKAPKPVIARRLLEAIWSGMNPSQP